MKIAIAVEEQSMESIISPSFTRGLYFLIYDTRTHMKTYLNNEAKDKQGGAGIIAAQIIVDEEADVLLTPKCTGNAADILEAANISLYKTRNNLALVNIEAFKNGKLSLLEEIHHGFHKHG